MTNYEIMHGDNLIATITSQGQCRILLPAFMPCNLYLEATDELDARVNNITNFYYWCATRLLTLDRKYAKQILNSMGMSQATTDKERARIALSYHCLTLTDIYWVREAGEDISFAQINLYENHLSNAFIDVSLKGHQMTVGNAYLLADDASTSGCFPKAWLREADGFWLLKDGDERAVQNELLASRICQCFRCNQVIYEPYEYGGLQVSRSHLLTNLEYSIVSREAFEIYAVNHDVNPMDYILNLDAYSYYMMNILDYLVGNTDRHWGNWGFLVDNRTGQTVRLHDLMDFNQSFLAYDTIEGAGCLTTVDRKISQKDAAIEAVNQIGLNQIAEIQPEWFAGCEEEYQMFRQRLQLLRAQGCQMAAENVYVKTYP